MQVHATPTDGLLILASGSPQRRRLLEECGYRFRVVVPSVRAECGVCSRETPGEMVARLAYQKAADVRDQITLSNQPVAAGDAAAAIVACDTVAECAGQILGKPQDREHARQMLRLLSGQEHRVYSGLCVWPLDGRPPRVDVARTTLVMAALAESQIEDYLDSEQWQDKAGAFGYQDSLPWLTIVEGSESNVIGLPLELLAEMLAAASKRGPSP